MGFKDTIKGWFPKYSPKTNFWAFFGVNMASGGLAGAGSLCIVYPLDYARTRLASDDGSGVSVLGIIPFRGTYFGVNDTLVGMIPKELKNDHGFKGIVAKFGCAQTAALCAAYASYPFDTVRRRLQMQSEKPPEEWVYKGSADCLGKIMKEEGFGALFKGAGANALRTVGSALVLVLYGEIKAALS